MYADITKFVREGRFVPVGGTWVEMVGSFFTSIQFALLFFSISFLINYRSC